MGTELASIRTAAPVQSPRSSTETRRQADAIATHILSPSFARLREAHQPPPAASLTAGCPLAGTRPLLLACCIVAAVVIAMRTDRTDVMRLMLWARSRKHQGKALFVLLYAASLVLMIPGSILALLAGAPPPPAACCVHLCVLRTPTMAGDFLAHAGAYFGLVWGVLLVYVSNVVGQTASFLLARYCLRDAVERCVAARWRHFALLDAAVQREGPTLVFVLRLNPCIPYTVLNYALGLTRLSFASYSWASAIAIVPFVVAYVYMGCVSGNVVELLEGGWAAQGAMLPWALGSTALVVATIAYGWFFTKRALTDALEGAMTPQAGAPRTPEQHSAGPERHRVPHVEA